MLPYIFHNPRHLTTHATPIDITYITKFGCEMLCMITIYTLHNTRLRIKQNLEEYDICIRFMDDTCKEKKKRRVCSRQLFTFHSTRSPRDRTCCTSHGLL